jgi:hypothetical protein
LGRLFIKFSNCVRNGSRTFRGIRVKKKKNLWEKKKNALERKKN